jgi:hypothetical protein
MKKKLYLFIFLSLLFVGIGCATKQLWISTPNMQQASNEYFDATISPIYTFEGYKGFILYINNKTTGNLEVDWNNTFYIYNGKKEGDFWFKGIAYADRKKSKPPDIVTGVLFTKEIYANNLLYFSPQLAKAWVHEAMKAGENGVYLTVRVNGKVITETLQLNFSIGAAQ